MLNLAIDHVNGSAILTKEKYYICQEVSAWQICICASLHAHLPDSTHYTTKTFMAQLEKVRAKTEGNREYGHTALILLPSEARSKHRVQVRAEGSASCQPFTRPHDLQRRQFPSWVRRKPDLQPSMVWLRITANGQGLHCGSQFEFHVQTWKNHQYSAVVYPKASTGAPRQKASLRLNKLTVIRSSCIFRLTC